MKKTLKTFSVEYLQILDEKGICDEKLKPSLTSQQIKKMYELMVRSRAFDDKAIKLQRQGRLGTYASIKGQEACQAGSAIQTQKDDLIVPAFREHAAYLQMGVTPLMLLQYWGGDERGSKFKKPINILPVSIPVGSHPIHAVGAAMAFQFQKKKAAVITYFGDGATSEGDTMEAFNFAGVFKAPVVFICQNNQYAISLPVKEQTAASTIAQKAIAYGFPGIQIDGNDIFAVYKATQDALKRARSGKGPTLIECFTYRLGDHTTADDASKYRTEKEVKAWQKKGPIVRLEKYMLKKKIASQTYFNSIKENAIKEIAKAVEQYEALKPAPIDDLFDYTFATLPKDLENQKAQCKAEVK